METGEGARATGPHQPGRGEPIEGGVHLADVERLPSGGPGDDFAVQLEAVLLTQEESAQQGRSESHRHPFLPRDPE